jgi:hypothetical protein
MTTDALNVIAESEYSAEDFWPALNEAFPSIAKELRNEGASTITQDQWTAIRKLPGFYSGMPHAPEALIVTDEA